MEIIKVKSEKGISMVTLITTIVLMLIISAVMIYNSRTSMNLDKLDKMYADIQTLQDKVDIYYVENKKLPVSTNPSDTITYDEETKTIFGIQISENDGKNYSKISDEFKEGLGLNYDTDYYINLDSHIVYSADGINIDNNQYHRANTEYAKIDNPFDSSDEGESHEETEYIDITFDYLDKEFESQTLKFYRNTIIDFTKGTITDDTPERNTISWENTKKKDGTLLLGWTRNKYGVGDLIDTFNLKETGDVNITVYAAWEANLNDIQVEQFINRDNSEDYNIPYNGEWTNKSVYHRITKIQGNRTVDHYVYAETAKSNDWTNISDIATVKYYRKRNESYLLY